jgi:hypothetical protein
VLTSIIAESCPKWVDTCTSGETSYSKLSKFAPLIEIDNFPSLLGEDMQASFSISASRWANLGASIIISSSPSASPSVEFFPDAVRLTSSELTVDSATMRTWHSKLCLPALGAQSELVPGIPALVSAMRQMRQEDASPYSCRPVREAASRVLRGCLDDPTPDSIKRLMLAMILLGCGSFSELAALGIEAREDDLFQIEYDYPPFGVVASEGSFACVACDASLYVDAFERLWRSAPDAAYACAVSLVARRDLVRAPVAVRALDDAHLALVMSETPLFFADACANDLEGRVSLHVRTMHGPDEDAVRRRLRSVGALFESLRTGAVRTTDLLPVDVDPACFATIVAGYYAMPFPAGRHTCMKVRPSILRESERLERVAREAAELSAAAFEHDDELCEGLSEAFRSSLSDLDDFSRGLLLHFAAECELLCGTYAHALSWLDQERARQDERDHVRGEGIPGTLTGLLLEADDAFAFVLANRFKFGREEVEDKESRLERVAGEVERRGMRSFSAALGLYVAVAQALCGREPDAAISISRAHACYAAAGDTIGQLATLVVKTHVQLANSEPGHAGAGIEAAGRICESSIKGRWNGAIELQRALLACSEGRSRTDDAHLLAYELADRFAEEGHARRGTLEMLERAAASAAGRDYDGAALIIDGLMNAGSARDAALAYLACRCLGDARAEVLRRVSRPTREKLESGDPKGAGRARRLQSAPDRRPLQIVLLGELDISLNGHQIGRQRWGRKRSRDLVLELAMAPGMSLTRDQACRILWPGSSPSSQRGNLSAVLSTARKMLGQVDGGPTFLLTNDEEIALNPQTVGADVERLRSLCRRLLAMPKREGEQVVDVASRIDALYGDGVDRTTGIRDDGTWGMRAEDIKTLFADCMLRASIAARESGSPVAALRFARRSEAARPGQEETQAICEDVLGEIGLMSGASVEPGRECDESLAAFPASSVREGASGSMGEDGSTVPLEIGSGTEGE